MLALVLKAPLLKIFYLSFEFYVVSKKGTLKQLENSIFFFDLLTEMNIFVSCISYFRRINMSANVLCFQTTTSRSITTLKALYNMHSENFHRNCWQTFFFQMKTLLHQRDAFRTEIVCVAIIESGRRFHIRQVSILFALIKLHIRLLLFFTDTAIYHCLVSLTLALTNVKLKKQSSLLI